MGYMEALGRLYDLSLASSGARDGHQAAVTGFRVSTRHASSLNIVLIKGVGIVGDDPVLTISSATLASGGSLTAWPVPASPVTASTGGGLPQASGTQNLSQTPQWYYKKGTGGGVPTLTGAEAWSRNYATVNASGQITLTGEATNSGIYVIPINPTDPVTGLGTTAGGFPDYLEVDLGSLAHPQYIALLYILGDLEIQQDPTRMFGSQT
jgi:hypothetical protein